MTARARLLLSTLVLALSMVGLAPAYAATGTLTITVTRPDATPAPGMYVQASNWAAGVTRDGTTDAQGRLTITGAPAGSYDVVTGGGDDYQGEQRTVSLADGGAASVEIRLVPMLSISGRATPPAGASAEGVHVIVEARFGGQAWDDYTDAEGDWSVGGLRRGEYRVSFYGEEIPTQLTYWHDRWGGNAGDVVTLVDDDVTGLDQTLVRAGTISGQVTLADGTPVPGFPVIAVSQTELGYSHGVVTDEDGRYTVPAHLPDLRVEFGFETFGRYFGVEPATYPDRLTVPSGTHRTGIDAEVGLSHPAFTARVLKPDGSPLAGATGLYCLQPADACYGLETDARGRFWLQDLFVGNTLELVRIDGRTYDGQRLLSQELGPFPLTAGSFRDLDITLERDRVIWNVGMPAITGTPRPGHVLTASTGEWDPEPDSYEIQWLLDGDEIAGATAATYSVRTGDVGSDLSVQVTALKADHDPSIPAWSADVEVEPDPASYPANVTPPRVTATPRVGVPLTVDPGTWSPAGDIELTYHWFRGSRSISGATGATYVPTAADEGKRLACLVVGSNSLDSASERATAPADTLPGTLVAPVPTVSGRTKVGRTLTGAPGVATPDSARPSYRWKRGSRFVRGANAARYRLVRADKGARMSVVVTWKLPGYRTRARTSATTAKVS